MQTDWHNKGEALLNSARHDLARPHLHNPYGQLARSTYHGRSLKRAITQDAAIKEIELDAYEAKELDQLAEETRKCGISWKNLNE